MAVPTRQHRGRCVHANGIDIHLVEAGEGTPLLLLWEQMIALSIYAFAMLALASVRLARENR